jgi:hypothetical protein
MEINLQDNKQQEDQEYAGTMFWEFWAIEYVVFFFASNIIDINPFPANMENMLSS